MTIPLRASRTLSQTLKRASRPIVRGYSGYSPSLAGLTEEQAEVCQPHLSCLFNHSHFIPPQLRSTVSAFFDKEVAPLAESTDKNNAFPNELWEKFGELGILGLTAPEEYGGLGKGYLDHTIVMEELVLSGGPLGLMQAAFDDALPYVHDRKQFGVPVGTFQLMQGKIADMFTKISATRSYVYAVGREAMQMLGGNGYIKYEPFPSSS
ncbi:hypothetical protein P7C70_g112, partial [Phenoliferia sp. Uapishka_3]